MKKEYIKDLTYFCNDRYIYRYKISVSNNIFNSYDEICTYLKIYDTINMFYYLKDLDIDLYIEVTDKYNKTVVKDFYLAYSYRKNIGI